MPVIEQININNYAKERIIWRYMDLYKFLDMLQTNEIHFTKLCDLEDKFEGTLTLKEFSLRDAKSHMMRNEFETKVMPILSQSQKDLFNGPNFWNELQSKVRQDMRESTFINCWHLSNYENHAMWKLYGLDGNGIAIISSIEKLYQELNSSDADVIIGKVDYIDYEIEMPKKETDRFFMYKRKEFEYEQELRASIMVDKIVNRTKFKNKNVRLKVNLNSLITKIILSPNMPKWKELVVRRIINNELKAKIDISTFNSRPLI